MTGVRNRPGLHEAIHEITDPSVVMRRVADQALVVIPAAKGAIVEVLERGQLRVVCGAGTLETNAGTRLELAASLAGAACASGATVRCDDVEEDPRVDATRARVRDTASIVCVPLSWNGGVLGVLTITATLPRAFSDAAIATLERLADFVATAIGVASELGRATEALLSAEADAAAVAAVAEDIAAAPGANAVSEFVANILRPGLAQASWTRERIEDVIASSAIDFVCQPIVSLGSGQTVGMEALARFPRRLAATPDVWFQQAHAVGLGVQLELAAVASALELRAELPPAVFLAINIGPQALIAPELAQMLDHTRAGSIVLELTEHVRVDDYPGLTDALAAIRPGGPALAIDDTGAGYASLAHILRLDPDIIKLDRSLTGGIDADPIRRRLAALLVELARDMDAKVIAEGIETAAELEAVRALGVDYGQGYFIGRPAPLASVPV